LKTRERSKVEIVLEDKRPTHKRPRILLRVGAYCFAITRTEAQGLLRDLGRVLYRA